MKLQIKIEGKTYTAEVEVLEEDENERLPSYVPCPPISAPIQSTPGTHTPAHAPEAHSASDKLYRSPVTGLVVKVNVKPGQKIETNEVIMVLEAMKMETSVTAHQAGRVKSVTVRAGDPVKLHQVLVELE